ncbi:hypothetical protein JBKA6_0065 [Ichthyobacterium seriolicida]|uniref:Uncharacterized protein n=2 Tax=Ichthyobacterium seriolicida TaxID=242600 RepID=A0A1J1E431_9FLAO|nr:hypothetical protein JBKA6_0065 [Ichthyobacterium seriolicida]
MDYMFYGAAEFNRCISSCHVSEVAHMSSMFDSAILFDQNLSERDISSISYVDASCLFSD